MKERALNLKAWEVRAILEGRKTSMRRAVKLIESGRVKLSGKPTNWHLDDPECVKACPYGQPGDRLWGRETHAPIIGQGGGLIGIDYRATYEHGTRLGDQLGMRKRWTSAIHMRREYSRILLEVTDVRAERLQDIGKDGRKARDVLAEGIEPAKIEHYRRWFHPDDCPALAYQALWKSIHGPGSWDANPFVWAVSFRRIEDVK